MYTAKDVMIKDVITVTPETPALDALSLLVGSGITGVPVTDNDRNPVGIITEKDLLNLISHPEEDPGWVGDYMTKTVFSLDADDSMIDVCNCLLENNFRRVPILSNGDLVGIISRRDVLKFLLELRLEAGTLKVEST